MSRSTLLVFRHSPYGSSLARAGLDLALAAGAFEQPVSVLFTGAGVLQLLQEQDTGSLGDRNYGKNLSSLPLYGLESLYVDEVALSRHGLSKTALPDAYSPVDLQFMQHLLATHDHLVGF